MRASGRRRRGSRGICVLGSLTASPPAMALGRLLIAAIQDWAVVPSSAMAGSRVANRPYSSSDAILWALGLQSRKSAFAVKGDGCGGLPTQKPPNALFWREQPHSFPERTPVYSGSEPIA